MNESTSERLKVLLLEPYYGGSHRAWADGYRAASEHDVQLLTLPAQAWKWRMQGGAVTLARLFEDSDFQPNVVLASDMMNLATFRALTRHRLAAVPHALYFHENQLTYPQNSRQYHGWRYGFVNYVSAMSADSVFFNSAFHMDIFFDALPKMLKHFYDFNELETVELLRQKAHVLPLGMQLERLDEYQAQRDNRRHPLIVWNHRWDEDKNPTALFEALVWLDKQGVEFEVAIVGENTNHETADFDVARERLGHRVLHWGYVASVEDYARLLWRADYVVSTAIQEFFGGSVAEAIYCGCIPILPNRLNYPNLLPAAAHDACLYPEDHVLGRWLLRHLRGELNVETDQVRAHVAQYDWEHMASQYDDAIRRLALAFPQPPVA